MVDIGSPWVLGALFVCALLVAVYFVVRSGGYWAENDTAMQGLAIRTMVEGGRLAPDESAYPRAYAYPNGYGYAAISTALLAFTGLTVSGLQQLVYPLTSALLVFPAWALYRELTGTWRGAALATLLLLLQPEFLFVVLRGSHERVLRCCMMLSLWLLIRSFRFGERPGAFTAHVGLFYVVAFGLMATNALFGISFVLAIALALGLGWLLAVVRPRLIDLDGRVLGRLTLTVLAVAGLGFLFIFYVYPLASHGLRALNQVVVASVTTTEEATADTPERIEDTYAAVVAGWTSLEAYFLVSSGTYLLMASSALVWIWQAVRWARGHERPVKLSAQLLWLLYGAFAIQGALAIVGDRSGLLGANLQYRAFPSFALLAAPLVARALQRQPLPHLGRGVVALGLGVLAGLGALKATTEPGLSNKWSFYTVGEMQALEWGDRYSRSEPIWLGWDERLSSAFALDVGFSEHQNIWDIFAPETTTRLFLYSDVVELQAVRFGRPLLAGEGENRIYDNGTAQYYRLRPRTPFQR